MGTIEAALIVALRDGPAPCWEVAQRVGRSVLQVEAILRNLRAEGRVVAEWQGVAAVRVWRLPEVLP